MSGEGGGNQTAVLMLGLARTFYPALVFPLLLYLEE